MSCRRAARRPRGGAEARPDAKACAPAASRIASNTTDPARPAEPLTDAQALVGTASWLASLRDWLAEELDLADGEAVQLRRPDVERVREGLTRCVACLDTVAIDPAQLPPLDDAWPEAAPSHTTPSPRTFQ